MKITVNPDLSSHVVTDDDSMECFLPSYNPETLVPFGSENEVRSFIATSMTANYFTPFKSAEEHAAEALAAKVAANTARAKAGLVDTDWCENASVRNTSVTPHLTNVDAFDAYRLALRAILVNKVADVETWPEQPSGTWST